MVGYDVAVKIATDRANVFSFTAALVFAGFAAHLAVLGLYRYLSPATPLRLDTKETLWALAGGIGLLVMNIGFFMGVHYGGLVKTNTVWLVGGLLLSTLIGFMFFHEQITAFKLLGIGLGTLSIIFLVIE